MGNQDEDVTLQVLQTRTEKLERWLRVSAVVWLLSFGLIAVACARVFTRVGARGC